jgi:glycosyltransferase involved in cell wall biosynthesis
MKNIFILVDTEIMKGKTAASARLRNYTNALASKENTIFLCSAIYCHSILLKSKREEFPNVFNFAHDNEGKTKKFLPGNLRRIFYIFSYYRKIIKLLKETPGDRIVFLYPSSNPWMELLGLFFLKFLHREKVFYEANEVRKAGLYNYIYSDSIIKKIIQKILVKQYFLLYSLAEWLTRYYDGIIAISTNIEDYFSRFNKNIIRIPILTDISRKQFNSPPGFDLKKEPFKICFTGSIILKKEGLDLLYESFAKLKQKNIAIEFHLYGPVSPDNNRQVFHLLPEKFNIKEDIHYHGELTPDAILQEMQKYHLLILPRPLSFQTKYGFSTKLSEYLISGVPILVTQVSDNGLYIKDGENGFIVEPGNVDAMTAKLIYIRENYNEVAKNIVESAFETSVKFFHYKNYSTVLNDFIK